MFLIFFCSNSRTLNRILIEIRTDPEELIIFIKWLCREQRISSIIRTTSILNLHVVVGVEKADISSLIPLVYMNCTSYLVVWCCKILIFILIFQISSFFSNLLYVRFQLDHWICVNQLTRLPTVRMLLTWNPTLQGPLCPQQLPALPILSNPSPIYQTPPRGRERAWPNKPNP